jgi:hypothetical protein
MKKLSASVVSANETERRFDQLSQKDLNELQLNVYRTAYRIETLLYQNEHISPAMREIMGIAYESLSNLADRFIQQQGSRERGLTAMLENYETLEANIRAVIEQHAFIDEAGWVLPE